MTDKPSATCILHVAMSLDGSISADNFRLSPDGRIYAAESFRTDDEYFKPKSQVCMVGCNSIYDRSVLEKPENFPETDRPGDRTDFHADLATNPVPAKNHYYCWVDPNGRLSWKTNTRYNERFPHFNGDRIVEVLVEDRVSDNFLAHLRKINIPYIFAGKKDLDCKIMVDKLGKLFNTDTVVSHGGGTLNGTLLEQDVVRQVSIVYIPVVSGDPLTIPAFKAMPGCELHMSNFDLEYVEEMKGGCMWLRYDRKH